MTVLKVTYHWLYCRHTHTHRHTHIYRYTYTQRYIRKDTGNRWQQQVFVAKKFMTKLTEKKNKKKDFKNVHDRCIAELLVIGVSTQLDKIHNSSLNTTRSARHLGFIFENTLHLSYQIISLSLSVYNSAYSSLR